MKKLTNWLFYGLSGKDVDGSPLNDHFEDTFAVVSKDSLQIYCTYRGFKDASALSALVPNTNLYCMSKKEEEDQD